ncbi:MAG: hypothetical protein J6R38_01040 [Alistipes sp.]|nr:hypothetical protein [Alistipes sp.]
MKARFLAITALILGMVSCQKDQAGLDVIVDGEQETTISVSLPETTRANSADSGFKNVNLVNEYDIRYILEIYDGENRIKRMVNVEDNSKSTAFDVRLIPGYPYTFVAWADFVDQGSVAYVDGVEQEIDLYYNTKTANGLKAVSVKGEWVAMNEARDAYTGKYLEDSYSSASNITIPLVRPFAKLRVVTTDVEVLKNLGDVTTTNVSVDYRTKVYTGFNALTAEANTAEDLGAFEYVPNVYTETNQTDLTLLADYLFGTVNGTIQFDLTATFSNGKETSTNFNTDIPLYRNKVTTIKGNILTDGSNIKVDVEDGFVQPGEDIEYVEVSTAADLQEVINNPAPNGDETHIVLGGNIDLSDLFGASTLSTRAGESTYGLLIPAGKEVVLDLKGYTISQSKEQTGAYSMIDNKGTLTIEDSSANKSGKIVYGDNGNGGNYASNTIWNTGVLTINGGTIENNSSATVASNGFPHPIDNYGVLTINGGTFTNNANYSSMRIWCTTDDDTIITINGGTFNGSIDFQTPNAAANKGTLTINGGTFNADTYTNCSVRLLGFGADVDEMNGYIKGGHFNGAIALKNWSGSELNSKVFNITSGTFTVDPSEFVDDDYNVVENNGVYSLELKDVIAKIGEVEYRSLQKAFDAVDNGTIQLIGDVTLKSCVVLNEGKVATLDLNGKTITATEYAIENYGTLKIDGNGTINGIVYCETGNTTVENGTFNATESGTYVFLNSQGGTLTINGGTINGGSSYPIYSYDKNSSLVINNVTVNATFGCVNAYGTNGSVVINGGTYKMTGVQGKTSHIAYFSNVDATINGGTFQKISDINMSAAGGGGICAIYGANLTINGGDFAGDYADVYNWSGTNANGRAVAISIKGGSYKFKPNAAFVAEGYKVVEDNSRWAVVVDPAAKIGETEYATLQEAFNVGGNITLLRNVTVAETVTLAEGKSVTLDLNGKTISHSDVENKYAFNNHGTLIIKDSKDGGSINARGIYNGYGGGEGAENVATAKLIVESGVINAKGTNGGAAVFNYGIADIKGGSFTSIGGYSLNNQNNASMTIADGVVANNGVYATNATVVINGGEISGNRSGYHVIYGWNANITINDGTFYNNNSGNSTVMAAGTTVITYNDGTFGIKDGRVPGNGNTWTSCLLDSANSATVVINNGIYNGGFRVQSGTSMTINGGSFNDCYGSNYNINGTVAVKGGTYTDETAKRFANKYIADGYEMNANGEVVLK